MPDDRPSSGVSPHITIRDGRCAEAIDFYTRAFAAREMMRNKEDDGERLMFASVIINGDYVMMHDHFPEYADGAAAPAPASVVLHLAVDDADAWWQRALDAGAQIRFPIADQFWGDRYGQLTDPFGHTWSIGSPLS